MTEEQINDRFNRYEALYVLCSRWHGGQNSRGYRLLSWLKRKGFKPGLSVNEGCLCDEALDYYEKWLHLRWTL